MHWLRLARLSCFMLSLLYYQKMSFIIQGRTIYFTSLSLTFFLLLRLFHSYLSTFLVNSDLCCVQTVNKFTCFYFQRRNFKYRSANRNYLKTTRSRVYVVSLIQPMQSITHHVPLSPFTSCLYALERNAKSVHCYISISINLFITSVLCTNVNVSAISSVQQFIYTMHVCVCVRTQAHLCLYIL